MPKQCVPPQSPKKVCVVGMREGPTRCRHDIQRDRSHIIWREESACTRECLMPVASQKHNLLMPSQTSPCPPVPVRAPVACKRGGGHVVPARSTRMSPLPPEMKRQCREITSFLLPTASVEGAVVGSATHHVLTKISHATPRKRPWAQQIRRGKTFLKTVVETQALC